MQTRTVRFHFAVMLPPESSTLGYVLAGKSFKGAVRLGDQFTLMTPSWAAPSVGESELVALTVCEIELYGTLVKVIEPGLGCRILVTGFGADRVCDGALLVGERRSTDA